MKIAFVITHPIQYYVPLLKGLSAMDGLEIKVFYTWGKDSVKKFDPAYNKVIEWDIPLMEGYDFEFLENVAIDKGSHHFKGIDNPKIIEEIKKFHPDKLVVFGWSYKSHLAVLRYFKNKIPIYFRGDSHLLNNTPGLKSILRRLFLWWVYRHIDYPISVGLNNRKYYEWLGIKSTKILFAPHAIENKRFSERVADHTPKYTKESLGIPKENIIFLYCGSFEARKNLSHVIEAKRKCAHLPCSLVLVGNGAQEAALKNLAGDDSQIHFIDFVNQATLPEIYRLADVFVLASSIETWGLVVNEAMASGLAIIASDKVGCAADLVSTNGFIFETGNIDQLSGKMKELMENPEMLNTFKENSKKIISDWSMEVLVNKFGKVLLNEF